jgi:hypothetical protein
MAHTFLLDALDFAGDLMPLVQPTEQGAGAEPCFLNVYLVRACVRTWDGWSAFFVLSTQVTD